MPHPARQSPYPDLAYGLHSASGRPRHTTIGSDGPSHMVKRPTGSGGEPSSPNCGVSAGVKVRHPNTHNGCEPCSLAIKKSKSHFVAPSCSTWVSLCNQQGDQPGFIDRLISTWNGILSLHSPAQSASPEEQLQERQDGRVLGSLYLPRGCSEERHQKSGGAGGPSFEDHPTPSNGRSAGGRGIPSLSWTWSPCPHRQST